MSRGTAARMSYGYQNSFAKVLPADKQLSSFVGDRSPFCPFMLMYNRCSNPDHKYDVEARQCQ